MNDAILAVDVGTVRIGVAIAERVDLPPMPLTTISHTNRAADLTALVALARERGAGVIVVGNPLRLDGSVGPAAERIEKFVDDLRLVFDGVVARADERLTTAAATKKLMQFEMSGGKRRRVVDQVAAVEILTTYLADRRRPDA